MAQVQSAYENKLTPMPMKLRSRAFMDGQRLPQQHSADGADLSPPLAWSRPPEGTRTLALVCQDEGTMVHWLIWNIPADRNDLDEGMESTIADEGMVQGQNGFGTYGYIGPNPPPRTPTQMMFRLYALDTPLSLNPAATLGEVEQACTGHVLAEAQLKARYIREL